jgi:hypothetical protein
VARLLLAGAGLLGTATAPSAAPPVLFFSDLVSGPRTGNSDGSAGRVPGRDGAIVTLWGRHLGSRLADVEVVCGGVPAASYYALGSAVSAADLARSHGAQRLVFQISRTARDGPGEILVRVRGKASNRLAFTVRRGRIVFVKTSGSDATGDGTWQRPWRSLLKASKSLAPGDIAYLGDGVSQLTETAFGAAVNLGSDGLPGRPKALIAYPGARVRIGHADLERAFHNWRDEEGGYTGHWLLSQLEVVTGGVGIPLRGGSRAVGNRLTAPRGNGMDGVIDGEGNDLAILGNEITQAGSLASSKLYHAIYLKGERRDSGAHAPTESGREVAWNYLHDNLTNRAINVYSEQDAAAFIEGHRIHDNVVVRQRGDGILLGYYVTGENRVWNNLIVEAGLGPEWPDDSSTHAGIRVDSGHETRRATRVSIHHNTLYGCGWAGAFAGESGLLMISQAALDHATALEIGNNVFVSQGEPYVAGDAAAPTVTALRNCWHGQGAPPSWDPAGIAADPRFVSPAAGDLRLGPASPCRNAALAAVPWVPRDLDGNRRPLGVAPDLGAYEQR